MGLRATVRSNEFAVSVEADRPLVGVKCWVPEPFWWVWVLFAAGNPVFTSIGIGTMINGAYQIKTGRRNGWITAATLGLAVVLFVVAWVTNRGLGG